jgi:hypothetical protein
MITRHRRDRHGPGMCPRRVRIAGNQFCSRAEELVPESSEGRHRVRANWVRRQSAGNHSPQCRIALVSRRNVEEADRRREGHRTGGHQSSEQFDDRGPRNLASGLFSHEQPEQAGLRDPSTNRDLRCAVEHNRRAGDKALESWRQRRFKHPAQRLVTVPTDPQLDSGGQRSIPVPGPQGLSSQPCWDDVLKRQLRPLATDRARVGGLGHPPTIVLPTDLFRRSIRLQWRHRRAGGQEVRGGVESPIVV